MIINGAHEQMMLVMLQASMVMWWESKSCSTRRTLRWFSSSTQLRLRKVHWNHVKIFLAICEALNMCTGTYDPS